MLLQLPSPPRTVKSAQREPANYPWGEQDWGRRAGSGGRTAHP